MKINSIYIIAAAGAMMLAGCAKEGTDGGLQADGTISAIRVSTGGFFNADGAQSRAADDGYNTTFVSGDKIGLTVVGADGTTILHDNIELTYTSGAWMLPSSVELWHYAGATYIAYYPYSEVMAGKKTTDEIVAAFEPKANQAAYANYTGSDLMVWSGSASGTTTAPVLNISLAHAMALIIVEPRGAGYTAPEGAAWVWHDGAGYDAPSDVQITVTVGGTEYTPYAMLDAGNSTDPAATSGSLDGTYRILVKPGLSVDIAVKYKTMDAQVDWNTEMVALSAGKYAKYNVNPPATLSVRGAAVGDYCMGVDADGKTILLPNALMTDDLKAACVGVVAIMDGANGKVLHKEESVFLRWSVEDIVTGATSETDGLSNMNKVQAENANLSNYPAFAWVDLKNGAAGATTYASGQTGVWYLPARDELIAVYNAMDSFNAALTTVGGTAYSSAPLYWSSTEFDGFSASVVYGDTGTPHPKHFLSPVRALLAF